MRRSTLEPTKQSVGQRQSVNVRHLSAKAHNPLDKTPKAADSARDQSHDDLNDPHRRFAQIKIMNAPAAEEYSQKSRGDLAPRALFLRLRIRAALRVIGIGHRGRIDVARPGIGVRIGIPLRIVGLRSGACVKRRVKIAVLRRGRRGLPLLFINRRPAFGAKSSVVLDLFSAMCTIHKNSLRFIFL